MAACSSNSNSNSNGNGNGGPSGNPDAAASTDASADGSGSQRLGDFSWKQETTTEVDGTVTSIGGAGPNLVIAVAYSQKNNTYSAYASRDGGNTWPPITAISPVPIPAVLYVVSSPGHAWVVSVDKNGVTTSLTHTTDGTTFDTFPVSASCSHSGIFSVGGTVLYAQISPSANTLQLCKSSDAGKTWTVLPPTYPSASIGGSALPFSTDNDLYLGNNTLPILHFNGSAFDTIGQYPTDWITGSAGRLNGLSIEDLYLARTGALIYHSLDRAKTWTVAASDLDGGDGIAYLLGLAPGDALATGLHNATRNAVVLRVQPDGSWKTVYKAVAPSSLPLMWSPNAHEVYAVGSLYNGNLFDSLIIKGTR